MEVSRTTVLILRLNNEEAERLRAIIHFYFEANHSSEQSSFAKNLLSELQKNH